MLCGRDPFLNNAVSEIAERSLDKSFLVHDESFECSKRSSSDFQSSRHWGELTFARKGGSLDSQEAKRSRLIKRVPRKPDSRDRHTQRQEGCLSHSILAPTQPYCMRRFYRAYESEVKANYTLQAGSLCGSRRIHGGQGVSFARIYPHRMTS